MTGHRHWLILPRHDAATMTTYFLCLHQPCDRYAAITDEVPRDRVQGILTRLNEQANAVPR